MAESAPLPTRHELEGIVRRALEAQVDGFPQHIRGDYNLHMAGINSIDLIVVLSKLEMEFDVSLQDVFVLQGYTISNIAERVHTAVAHAHAQAGHV